MSASTQPLGIRSKLGVRALIRSRYIPADVPITEIAPAAGGVNVVRDGGQSLTERDGEPSSRLINLLEQQSRGTMTAAADARRFQSLTKSAAGIRSLIRSR